MENSNNGGFVPAETEDRREYGEGQVQAEEGAVKRSHGEDSDRAYKDYGEGRYEGSHGGHSGNYSDRPRRSYDNQHRSYGRNSGEEGGYRPRRSYNQNDREGSYSRPRRDYNQRRPYGSNSGEEGGYRPRRSYNQTDGEGSYSRPRGDYQQRRSYDSDSGEEGGYRPRRSYNQTDGEGSYSRPRRDYNQRRPYGSNSDEEGGYHRRSYNQTDGEGSYSRPRGDYQQRRPYSSNSGEEGGYRPRHYYNQNDGEGGYRPRNNYGRYSDGQGRQRRSYNNDYSDRYSDGYDRGGKSYVRGTKLRPRKSRPQQAASESGIDRMIKRNPLLNDVTYSDNDLVNIPVKDVVRLNRFIANSGICSRREADNFISAGVVSVNGEVVTELGTKINVNTDDVRFNGERLRGEAKVYIVMNKPRGFVTTASDPHADKTVMDLIKGCPARVFPVGRLDKGTTGVLMFTNDGEIAEKLTHPSYDKKKIYQVTLGSPLSQEDYDKILAGVTLSDGEIAADALEYVDDDNHKKIGIEIHSGKNRIVRRIFESLGYEVKGLDRVYFAGLTKKGIKRGGWKYLTEGEVNVLRMGAYN